MLFDVAMLVEADRGRVSGPVAERLAPHNRAQPRDRMVRHGAVAQAPPSPDHGLLGDVGGVVGCGHPAGLTQAAIGGPLPVQIVMEQELRIAMKRF